MTDDEIFRAMVRHGDNFVTPDPIAEYEIDVIIESVEEVPAPCSCHDHCDGIAGSASCTAGTP